MPVSGSLKKEAFGFSMPVYAPLFPKPPYLYKDATLLIFEYVTNPQSAARLLPEVADLYLAEPPMAGLVFASYPWCNLGPYHEVVLYVRVVYQGQPLQFAAFLYVTTDAAMAAGREMGGYPKKMGRIEFLPGSDYAAVLERPAGLRICSGTMRPEQSQMADTPPFLLKNPLPLNYLTLRLIPSPVLGAPPTVSELLVTNWSVDWSEAWSGPGSCQLTGASELDPLHWAPVVTPLYSLLLRGNINVALNDSASGTPL
jgi:acetoacetate decarboxylase